VGTSFSDLGFGRIVSPEHKPVHGIVERKAEGGEPSPTVSISTLFNVEG